MLVALNPAALRANIRDVRPSGMIVLNSDAFNAKSLKLAGYDHDPLPELRGRYQLVEIPLTRLNRDALADLEISQRDADRSKNFFALGLMYWLYNRPMEPTQRWLEARFKGEVLEANLRVLKAGHAFAETTDLLPVSFIVPRAKIEPGVYRNITGNTALAWGIVAATVQTKRPVFLGAYPITPASDVLHEVARFRHFGIKTFQAEDEIAADQRGDRRLLRRRARGVHHERPRHGAEAGGARAGRDGRAPARRGRRPARRALHRDAHEDRAGRPVDGALRAQLRQPRARARAVDPG